MSSTLDQYDECLQIHEHFWNWYIPEMFMNLESLSRIVGVMPLLAFLF